MVQSQWPRYGIRIARATVRVFWRSVMMTPGGSLPRVTLCSFGRWLNLLLGVLFALAYVRTPVRA